MTNFNNSPVKAEIASSNLVGVANDGGINLELGGLNMARHSGRESILIDELKYIIEQNSDITGEELMSKVIEKIDSDKVDMQVASDIYNIPYSTISDWLQAGHIREYGRVANGKGTGANKKLVSLKEVETWKETRPRRGRPSRKSAAV